MKKEEIKKELKGVLERLFLIDMVDRWTNEDKEAYDRLSTRRKELEEMLENATRN